MLGEVVELAVEATGGIFSSWPTLMVNGETSALATASEVVLTENLRAIEVRVSPETTVYETVAERVGVAVGLGVAETVGVAVGFGVAVGVGAGVGVGIAITPPNSKPSNSAVGISAFDAKTVVAPALVPSGIIPAKKSLA